MCTTFRQVSCNDFFFVCFLLVCHYISKLQERFFYSLNHVILTNDFVYFCCIFYVGRMKNMRYKRTMQTRHLVFGFCVCKILLTSLVELTMYIFRCTCSPSFFFAVVVAAVLALVFIFCHHHDDDESGNDCLFAEWITVLALGCIILLAPASDWLLMRKKEINATMPCVHE